MDNDRVQAADPEARVAPHPPVPTDPVLAAVLEISGANDYSNLGATVRPAVLEQKLVAPGLLQTLLCYQTYSFTDDITGQVTHWNVNAAIELVQARSEQPVNVAGHQRMGQGPREFQFHTGSIEGRRTVSAIRS